MKLHCLTNINTKLFSTLQGIQKKTYEFTVGNQVPAYYGVDEFAIGEFTGGELTTRNSVQATGNGSIITIGLEADINGSALSLQEINVLALMGKTV